VVTSDDPACSLSVNRCGEAAKAHSQVGRSGADVHYGTGQSRHLLGQAVLHVVGDRVVGVDSEIVSYGAVGVQGVPDPPDPDLGF